MADAEKILTKIVKKIVENEQINEPDVNIKAITSGGANYTSTLHLITIKANGRKDLQLFAKVANLGEQLRSVMQADRMYATEMFVYQDLNKIYNELQDKKNIQGNERFVFPKFYACDATYLEETVILENLAANGYRLYNRVKSITWEYGAAAVEELAKLHALSYAYKEDSPEEFEKTVADIMFTFTGSENDMRKMFEMSTSNAVQIVPKEVKGRLEKFLKEYLDPPMFLKFYSVMKSPVLVHGDYRVSNLLYKRKGGKLEKLIPVDYQTLHCGSVTSDLVYFIFSGTDGEFRRLHYKRLIDHYYKTFTTFLGKLGHDANKLYSREDFDEELKEKLPYGLSIGAYLLPIVLVETDDAPKVDGDANFDNFVVKPNDLYKKRLCELVDEFIERRIL